MTRHSWPEHLTIRHVYKTERQCANGCGIIKVSHHQGDTHWTEFWRDGEKIERQGTPKCVLLDEHAVAAQKPLHDLGSLAEQVFVRKDDAELQHLNAFVEVVVGDAGCGPGLAQIDRSFTDLAKPLTAAVDQLHDQNPVERYAASFEVRFELHSIPTAQLQRSERRGVPSVKRPRTCGDVSYPDPGSTRSARGSRVPNARPLRGQPRVVGGGYLDAVEPSRQTIAPDRCQAPDAETISRPLMRAVSASFAPREVDLPHPLRRASSHSFCRRSAVREQPSTLFRLFTRLIRRPGLSHPNEDFRRALDVGPLPRSFGVTQIAHRAEKGWRRELVDSRCIVEEVKGISNRGYREGFVGARLFQLDLARQVQCLFLQRVRHRSSPQAQASTFLQSCFARIKLCDGEKVEGQETPTCERVEVAA